MLVGTLSRKSDRKGAGGERNVVIFVDFAETGVRQCGDGDFEKWYARRLGGDPDCLMGHKVSLATQSRPPRADLVAQQWFMRRKPDADCFIRDKFKDPVGREEDCPCTDEDYEWCVQQRADRNLADGL